MIMVNNPFGQDLIDFNEETEADRIGSRIRAIRNARGLSQAELGEKVGLSADRIQKYENGARKPKTDMLKKLAEALEVRPLALADPVTTSYIGAMYALFEMENRFRMEVDKAEDVSSKISISINSQSELYRYMEEWYRVYKKMKSDLELASSDEEKKNIMDAYHNWEWNFPSKIIDRTELKQQKIRIKQKIEELQEAYNQLDQEDDEE